MLTVTDLSAGYHGGSVLHGVSLTVESGSTLALIGRNGAGKSTLVHAIAGLLRPYSGVVEVYGANVAGKAAHRVARAGVGLVPQGRRVFPSLTVAEHLSLSQKPGEWSPSKIKDLLPRLAERLKNKGNQLSGGEQQMLAIARALLTQPKLLLLDEPCEGLSPDMAAHIRQLVSTLAGTGLTVLLVEQQLRHAIEVAGRIAVLDYGRLVLDRSAAEVRADPAPIEQLLTITRKEVNNV